jgi:hypothetical protein
MKQIAVYGNDDFNFYTWRIYVGQRNEYGEYRFNDDGDLLITIEELYSIASEILDVPADRMVIHNYHL